MQSVCFTCQCIGIVKLDNCLWYRNLTDLRKCRHDRRAGIQSEAGGPTIGIRKVDDLFAVMWLNKDTQETVYAGIV